MPSAPGHSVILRMKLELRSLSTKRSTLVNRQIVSQRVKIVGWMKWQTVQSFCCRRMHSLSPEPSSLLTVEDGVGDEAAGRKSYKITVLGNTALQGTQSYPSNDFVIVWSGAIPVCTTTSHPFSNGRVLHKSCPRNQQSFYVHSLAALS